MTEDEWKTIVHFLKIDGYRKVINYVTKLRADLEQAKTEVPRSTKELLEENEKLYRIIQQLRERKK